MELAASQILKNKMLVNQKISLQDLSKEIKSTERKNNRLSQNYRTESSGLTCIWGFGKRTRQIFEEKE